MAEKRRKKVWCSHITWDDHDEQFELQLGPSVEEWISADAYKLLFCPFCGKKNPRRTP
jgi:hypothetical protein